MFLTKNKIVTFTPSKPGVPGRAAYTYCRPSGGGGEGGGGGGGARCEVVCVPVDEDSLDMGGPVLVCKVICR